MDPVISPEDLKGRTLVAERNRAAAIKFQKTYPDLPLTLVDSAEEAFRQVASGQADACIRKLLNGHNICLQLGLPNIQVATTLPIEPDQICMAVRKDWPELASIVKKTITQITPKEHSTIRNPWMSIQYKQAINWNKILPWLFGSLAVILAVILSITVWNRLLRREIVHRKMLEESLREAKESAEQSNKVKSAFLANVSHELRTPLNSIIGFNGMLLKEMTGPLNFEQKKQLKMVKGSSIHLLDLINDVLDISKIEAGELTLSPSRFNYRELIQDTTAALLPLAEKKGLLLTAQIEENIHELVSDERRIKQVLINLINNAIKFTQQGQITIECRTEGNEVITTIADTGIGIAEEQITDIFSPFRQVDSGLSRQYEGTGLGLSISKRIIELAGGHISVESQPGKGSRFCFTLPQDKGASS
jgi:signal transduction histidine kinase